MQQTPWGKALYRKISRQDHRLRLNATVPRRGTYTVRTAHGTHYYRTIANELRYSSGYHKPPNEQLTFGLGAVPGPSRRGPRPSRRSE
jgi:hypothetical protein